MFKYLKRLMRLPRETSSDSAEVQNSNMDTTEREELLPRPQITQSRPEPGSTRHPNRSATARILCCLCQHGSEDSVRMENERTRSPPELLRANEDRIDQTPNNISTRSDFSITQSRPLCRREHSKISFHRQEDISMVLAAENLCCTDSGSFSGESSDTEYLDAREYLSSSDSEGGSPRNSTRSGNASILKRCSCMTCASVRRELRCPANYRVAEVFDARNRGEPRVRMNFDVLVAEYDIRSGDIIEERVQELNLSEEQIPIGHLWNTDMGQEIGMCGRC